MEKRDSGEPGGRNISFREKDLTLRESRKLRLAQMYFLRERELVQLEERNVVLDSFGNEVDPETGEILQGDAQ